MYPLIIPINIQQINTIWIYFAFLQKPKSTKENNNNDYFAFVRPSVWLAGWLTIFHSQSKRPPATRHSDWSNFKKQTSKIGQNVTQFFFFLNSRKQKKIISFLQGESQELFYAWHRATTTSSDQYSKSHIRRRTRQRQQTRLPIFFTLKGSHFFIFFTLSLCVGGRILGKFLNIRGTRHKFK